MIAIEIIAIIAFFIFITGAGLGIFFMCIEGTEVGRAVDELLARLIRKGGHVKEEEEKWIKKL